MKRSQINSLIKEAINLFKKHGWQLPPFAFYRLEDWKEIMHDDGLKKQYSEIFERKLGWDVSDFGSGAFEKVGLLLFTMRNGVLNSDRLYAEKIMVQLPGQTTPFHYHWLKCEDIINRGGGDLVVKLYNAAVEDIKESNGLDKNWRDGIFADSDVEVQVSGRNLTLKAGSEVLLKPGDYIVLTPKIYHSFWALPEKEPVIVGEVSMVNDDEKDNRFLKKLPRFSKIEYDEPPIWLLVNEYERILEF
ncbi:MAG: D-lyxose/D-mannose family sugar isomerase [Promethearchaeota archaeon]